jgi:lipopolysaccharide assembly outer membrane protein LptD (OstA)
MRFSRGVNTLGGTAYVHQYVYGDPDTTALYAYGTHLSDATKLTRYFTNTLRFDKDYNDGYTPFTFDAISKQDTLADSLLLKRGKLNLNLSCGRDLLYNQWQQMTFTSVVPVSPIFEASEQFSYDLNAHQWGDLVSEYSWFPSQRVICNLGTRYDLQTNQLKQIATQVNWVINPEWHVQWHGGYDGIAHQINYNEILLTRDLHCWDATFMYSEAEGYFGFYMRLKAFNTPLPNFGIGQGGQALNTDLGTSM